MASPRDCIEFAKHCAHLADLCEDDPQLREHPKLAAGVQLSARYAMFAPEGTPKPVRDRLSDALDRALDDENTRRRRLELVDIPESLSEVNSAWRVGQSEIARWNSLLKRRTIEDGNEAPFHIDSVPRTVAARPQAHAQTLLLNRSRAQWDESAPSA